jgi:hypothetical protein
MKLKDWWYISEDLDPLGQYREFFYHHRFATSESIFDDSSRPPLLRIVE